MKFFKQKYHLFSDEQLVEEIAKGQERAFAMLYDRYAQAFYQFFYKMLYQEKPLAEDFVQELFCRIFEQAHRFDTSRPFKTWAYSIAYNLCKNEYRKRGRQIATESLTENASLLQEEKAFFENRLEKQILDKSISELSPAQRDCIVLHYQQGLSIEEIGEVLECPKGTVKSRLFYGIKKLAEKLKKEHRI